MGYQRRVHGESTHACGGMAKIRILLAVVLFVCLVATSEGQRRKQGGNKVCKRDCSKSKGRERQKCIQMRKRAKCKKGNKNKIGGEKPKRTGKTTKGGNKNKGGQRDGNERLKDPVMIPCDEHDHKCLKVPNKLVKMLTKEVVERALDNFNSKKPLLLSRVGIDEKGKPFEEKKTKTEKPTIKRVERKAKGMDSKQIGCKKRCETKFRRKPKKIKKCKENCNGNGKANGKGNGKGKGKGKGNKRGKRDGRGGGGRRIHNGKGRDYIQTFV